MIEALPNIAVLTSKLDSSAGEYISIGSRIKGASPWERKKKKQKKNDMNGVNGVNDVTSGQTWRE